MNPLEQAVARLEEARAAHAAIAADLEARLAELPEDADADAVQAISDELVPQLDEAEALVERCRKQHATVEKLSRARQAVSELIPRTEHLEVREADTYDQRDPFVSFFGDLYAARFNFNKEAAARLERNHNETLVKAEKRGIIFRDKEGRALGSGSTAGGSFLPPLYFGDLYAEFKRARRVTATLVRNLPLASTGNTITIPRVTSGASTAAQTADNAVVSNTDAVTALLTVPVATVAGYVDLSRQIVERSEPGLDQIIIQDLLRDYNKQVNNLVVNGSGTNGQPTGILNQSGINSITFTSSTPTVGLCYPKLLDSVRQIEENVFEPAVAYVMTARRWAWFLAALDANNRPLVVPNPQGPFNTMGGTTDGAVFGDNTGKGIQSSGQDRGSPPLAPAGWLVGYPVYIDETLPKTQGAGTNQDVIITGAFDEAILWEDANGPRDFQFEGVTSQTAAIRVQVFGYMAFTAGRYPASSSAITGTGLVAPTF